MGLNGFSSRANFQLYLADAWYHKSDAFVKEKMGYLAKKENEARVRSFELL